MAKRKMVKKEARILGIDDGPFSKKDREVLIVGTVFCGGLYPDAILSTKVEVDGDDATEKVVDIVRLSGRRHLKAIMLKGVAFGGFNIIDIEKVTKKTKLPVIVIMRQYPDFRKIEKALLKRVKNGKKKLAIIKKMDRPARIKIKGKNLYMQFAGVEKEKAEALVQLTATRSFIPEPIRLAHMIAAGIISGKSKGRV